MLSDAKYIINNQISTKSSLPRCMTVEDTTIIPERYNTREQFSECTRPIHDQSTNNKSLKTLSRKPILNFFCEK